jgi:hypothetical protein
VPVRVQPTAAGADARRLTSDRPMTMSATATLARNTDVAAIRSAAAISVRPKAYSYVRWSTPWQSKSDSLIDSFAGSCCCRARN